MLKHDSARHKQRKDPHFSMQGANMRWVRKMGNRDSKDDTPARQLFNARVQLFITSAYLHDFEWIRCQSMVCYHLCELGVCLHQGL